MKIELEQNNKVFIFEGSNKWELNPIWLRERVKTENLVDKNNHQRLYDPSQLDKNLKMDWCINIKSNNNIKNVY